MKFIFAAIFVLSFSIFPVFAQEAEVVVIDEVVAQVNDSVITLSRVKREMKQFIDGLVQEQRKSPEAARIEVESKQGELIANLINEELLMQRGKEEGVDSSVEARINQGLLQMMKENKLKSLEELYSAMRTQGIDPDVFRENMRKQYTREIVISREVDAKVYYGPSGAQVKEYFRKHPEKFTKPEEVTLSAIFLNFAGRDIDATREKAKQLVNRLRKGEDFAKLALEYSDEPNVKESKGVQGKFKVNELNEVYAKPIKAVKVGGVTDPLENEAGIQIVRVDERSAASSESIFDEDLVRRTMMSEKLPDARRKFLVDLRKDAYIKVSENYRALVMPHLREDVATETKKPAK